MRGSFKVSIPAPFKGNNTRKERARGATRALVMDKRLHATPDGTNQGNHLVRVVEELDAVLNQLIQLGLGGLDRRRPRCPNEGHVEVQCVRFMCHA